MPLRKWRYPHTCFLFHSVILVLEAKPSQKADSRVKYDMFDSQNVPPRLGRKGLVEGSDIIWLERSSLP